jgi:hypothetical protein
MWLQPVDARKNRCHPDLEPVGPTAEVERLVALGASHADVGQTGRETFVVMVDPRATSSVRSAPTPNPTVVFSQSRSPGPTAAGWNEHVSHLRKRLQVDVESG